MTKPIHPRDLAAADDAADPFDPAHAADANLAGDAAAPSPAGDAPDTAAAVLFAFAPLPVRPHIDGWTAERQRRFLRALAETGSVGEACEEAGVTARSAYRLRLRAGAAGFGAAWRWTDRGASRGARGVGSGRGCAPARRVVAEEGVVGRTSQLHQLRPGGGCGSGAPKPHLPVI